MDELKWKWVYIPYLDAPDKQKESAIKAGYAKVYFKSDVDAELESLKASHYVENVDAGMENRRQKRALWLAREWRAWCEGQFWLAIPSDRPRDIYHLFMTNRIHRTPAEWMAYWHKVEQLCKKKAEEYK